MKCQMRSKTCLAGFKTITLPSNYILVYIDGIGQASKHDFSHPLLSSLSINNSSSSRLSLKNEQTPHANDKCKIRSTFNFMTIFSNSLHSLYFG